MALLINEKFPVRKLVRAAILLPWIVPAVLSGMAWQWMFTPELQRHQLDPGQQLG